ncbi:hypothetical protein PybrP1_009935, partial [[Pythium] brassicae (nom. inval.)]
AEILLLFCAAFVVYAHVFAEKAIFERNGRKNVHDIQGSHATPKYFAADVHTYRDLITEHSVAVGSRPDMKAIVNRAFEAHKIFSPDHPSTTGNKTVGVFISGPGAMKSATEHAVAGIGSSHFDLHEEEFEL